MEGHANSAELKTGSIQIQVTGMMTNKKHTMLKHVDGVQQLAGCGAVSASRLKAHGVITIGDLLTFTGSVKGVNIPKLKDKAKSSTTPDSILLESHTWYGLRAHIAREGGKVHNVVIGDIMVSKHRTLMQVSFIDQASKRFRSISPVCLMYIDFCWMREDISLEW